MVRLSMRIQCKFGAGNDQKTQLSVVHAFSGSACKCSLTASGIDTFDDFPPLLTLILRRYHKTIIIHS